MRLTNRDRKTIRALRKHGKLSKTRRLATQRSFERLSKLGIIRPGSALGEPVDFTPFGEDIAGQLKGGNRDGSSG